MMMNWQQLFPQRSLLMKQKPVEAQTGPAVRYDRNVLEAQRALLEGMPELQSLYDEMSRSIHRMALQEKKNEGVGYD